MHFEHNNVIRYDNRPFDTITQMDEVLINNWNARISDKDTVYVLGDAFFKGEEFTSVAITLLAFWLRLSSIAR